MGAPPTQPNFQMPALPFQKPEVPQSWTGPPGRTAVPPRSTGLLCNLCQDKGRLPPGQAEKQVGRDQGPSTLGPSPDTRSTASASVRLSAYVSGPVWRKKAEVGLRVDGKGPLSVGNREGDEKSHQPRVWVRAIPSYSQRTEQL